jgi:Flp pilus assembly protein TadG
VDTARTLKARLQGATTVEFALVLILFLTFALGIVDFSRMLFTWSAANEAARAGARFAVVCDTTAREDQVLVRMQSMLPQISDIDMAWIPAGCTPATCEGVTVSIANLDYQWISPVAGVAAVGALPMPTFSTFLTREMMGADPNDAQICEQLPTP